MRSRRTAWGVLCGGLVTCALVTAPGCAPLPKDPAAATVAALLAARRDASADPAVYAGLVATDTARSLAEADRLRVAGTSPVPGWKRPYVIEQCATEATVAVVWKPDAIHPGWPAATLFCLSRDGSAEHGWLVTDATQIDDPGELPPVVR